MLLLTQFFDAKNNRQIFYFDAEAQSRRFSWSRQKDFAW